jgi:hypothetical protein
MGLHACNDRKRTDEQNLLEKAAHRSLPHAANRVTQRARRRNDDDHLMTTKHYVRRYRALITTEPGS